MSTATSDGYQHLHTLLQQLHDAEYLLSHGPKRIALAEKKVARAELDCETQKAEIKNLRKSADQHNLDLATSEAEIEKLNGQLNVAKSNKEYDIIRGGIDTQQTKNAELEDQILEIFGAVDEAEAELGRKESAQSELEVNLSTIREEVAAKEPGLREEVDRLNAEICEAEKIIGGGDSVSAWKRLKAAQGPSALARVEDGYCAECNTQVTPQDSVRLNLAEFVLCRSCGRILYHVSDD